jgi:hypothetical protein
MEYTNMLRKTLNIFGKLLLGNFKSWPINVWHLENENIFQNISLYTLKNGKRQKRTLKEKENYIYLPSYLKLIKSQ